MCLKLILNFGHIHIGRTLSFAGLTLQTERKHIVYAVIRKPAFPPPRYRRSQCVCPPPRRMFFFQRCHIRRTHRAHQLFATLAHPIAHFNGAVKSPIGRKIKMGLYLSCAIVCPITQIFSHHRCIDNFAGIHQPFGIKSALDFSKSLVKYCAKERFVPTTSNQTIAVLPAHSTAVFHHQIAHRFSDKSHFGDLVGILEIDHRPNVQQAHAGVCIITRPRVERFHQRPKLGNIIGQPFWWNSGVFDKSDGFGIAFYAHEQSQPRLANIPNIGLLAIGNSAGKSVFEILISQNYLEFVQLRDQLTV